MDSLNYLQFGAALVFVIALMLGLSWVLKRAGLAQGAVGNGKRLKTIENLVLDSRNRLVLVQRDNIQHLLLIGANANTVIETGIKPDTAGRARNSQEPEVDEARR